ncbi:hypothetical protein LTR53_005430 [Teratosphaeriaceae sp. CCFEE 6253]|nr:hypothetical protein LTR53_005430 [Teratosphaeriaceae sp. CCFEE 6253]
MSSQPTTSSRARLGNVANVDAKVLNRRIIVEAAGVSRCELPVKDFTDTYITPFARNATRLASADLTKRDLLDGVFQNGMQEREVGAGLQVAVIGLLEPDMMDLKFCPGSNESLRKVHGIDIKPDFMLTSTSLLCPSQESLTEAPDWLSVQFVCEHSASPIT